MFARAARVALRQTVSTRSSFPAVCCGRRERRVVPASLPPRCFPAIADPPKPSCTTSSSVSPRARRLSSSSVTETYTPSLLAAVGLLAARFGDLLEVRFYGHQQGSFNCATLEKLPAVTNLSIDCLPRASNVEALAQLTNLRRLSLGIEELSDPQRSCLSQPAWLARSNRR